MTALLSEERAQTDVASAPVRRKRPLLRLICARVAAGVLTLFAVSVLIFLATNVLPGDAAQAVLGKNVNPQAIQELRSRLGLDRSLIDQYMSWLTGVLHGDLGTSLVNHRPVSANLWPALTNSATLIAVTLLVVVPVSLVLGCVAAVRRDGILSRFTKISALVLTATPEFVVGTFLVLFFATSVFSWFPAVSMLDTAIPAIAQPDKLFLPALTLALGTTPYLMLLIRAAVTDALDSEYVTMAELKGLSKRRIVFGHALPNSLAPTIQGLAVVVAWLAGEAVVVEFLFNFPGLGSALQTAVAARDVPSIQAVSLTLAIIVVVTNLVADVATVLVTPRLRTGGRS